MQGHLPIILASASPRRRELLSELVQTFEIVVSNVDEDALTQEDPKETARVLATAKAQAVFELHSGSLVIGADTVVAIEIDGRSIQLAKPTDLADAKRMLGVLSGKTHSVFTGVCLVSRDIEEAWVEETRVTFHELSKSTIEDYVATGEPLDKAGAYGAQARGRHLIKTIDGSLTNVIGLPMESLGQRLNMPRSS